MGYGHDGYLEFSCLCSYLGDVSRFGEHVAGVIKGGEVHCAHSGVGSGEGLACGVEVHAIEVLAGGVGIVRRVKHDVRDLACS